MRKLTTAFIAIAMTLTFTTLAFGDGAENYLHVKSASNSVNINDDLNGIRKNYSHWSGDCPLGDINRDKIGNSTEDQRLIFSESVSYALFSYVLQMTGEDENEAKRQFLAYWNCAKNRLIRKNINEVYSWDYDTPQYHTWIPMPDDIKDNLMAWRWVEKIQGTNRSGIIYQTADPMLNPETQTWQDGTQVASDGDLLTAYALYLAYQRGWGDDLLEDAKLMIKDLRQKAIIDFKAGEMVNAKKQPKPSNFYYGSFEDEGEGTIIILDEPDVIAWEGNNNYVGFWHEPPLDLSNVEKFEIKIKGHISDDSYVDFRIEDVVEGKESGHIYRTHPLALSDNFHTYTFSPAHFEKFTSYGEQAGELDWSKIRNLQVQVGKKAAEYHQYSETYNDGGEGSINLLDISNVIAWDGNRCFVGFSYFESLDIAELSEIRIKLKGTGNVDFRLIDEQEIAYYTGDIGLTSQFTLHTFRKNDFVLFPYGKQGGLDWSKIKNLQFQVSSKTNAHVEVESVEIELNGGETYLIENRSNDADSSYVAIESINIVLKEGQTHIHDGYLMSSNAHGAPFINVSYFMPFAYRVFKTLDTEGAAVWEALLEKTYQDLETSLQLTLHDMAGDEVIGNGQLFPNWYQLDQLTGQPRDVSTQKENTNVRAYQFGYDAFRTLWYLAYDYYLYGEPRDLEILEQVYPFFKEEMTERGYVYPVYKIDGTSEEHYDTPFGFYAVYLNIFKLMGDKENEEAILQKYSEQRCHSGDGRIWLKSGDCQEGEEEYFLNFWALFGLYLYNLLDYHNGDGIDKNSNLVPTTTCFIPSVTQTDETVTIAMIIIVDDNHVGQAVDLLMVANYVAEKGDSLWFMRNGDNWLNWEVSLDTLLPAETKASLNHTENIKIFEGNLQGLPGEIILYVGYLTPQDVIIYNMKVPIRILVE